MVHAGKTVPTSCCPMRNAIDIFKSLSETFWRLPNGVLSPSRLMRDNPWSICIPFLDAILERSLSPPHSLERKFLKTVFLFPKFPRWNIPTSTILLSPPKTSELRNHSQTHYRDRSLSVQSQGSPVKTRSPSSRDKWGRTNNWMANCPSSQYLSEVCPFSGFSTPIPLKGHGVISHVRSSFKTLNQGQDRNAAELAKRAPA